MTLKNAALLALIGTILATVLLVWTFVFTALNVLRGLAPPAMLFPWFVYAFACFSMAVFFCVVYKAIMILPKDGAVFDKCLVHGSDRIAAFMRGGFIFPRLVCLG